MGTMPRLPSIWSVKGETLFQSLEQVASAPGFSERSSDPRSYLASNGTMNSNDLPNPILPAARVRRSTDAAGIRARSPVGHDDGVPLNPLVRGTADRCKKPVAILKCTQSLKIATFNIQTLTASKITDEDSRLKTEELAWNMKKQSVEICGVQEHRQVHKM